MEIIIEVRQSNCSKGLYVWSCYFCVLSVEKIHFASWYFVVFHLLTKKSFQCLQVSSFGSSFVEEHLDRWFTNRLAVLVEFWMRNFSAMHWLSAILIFHLLLGCCWRPNEYHFWDSQRSARHFSLYFTQSKTSTLGQTRNSFAILAQITSSVRGFGVGLRCCSITIFASFSVSAKTVNCQDYLTFSNLGAMWNLFAPQ